MSDKIAAIIKRMERSDENYPGTLGEAVVYHLTPPLESAEWDYEKDDEIVNQHTYVLVSQAAPLGMWETYIFPADVEGEVTDLGELDGSQKGFFTPDDLMRSLGYKVIG